MTAPTDPDRQPRKRGPKPHPANPADMLAWLRSRAAATDAGHPTPCLVAHAKLVSWRGRQWPAARLALRLSGRLPDLALLALRRCDTPRCIREDPLYAGTAADHYAAMACRGVLRHTPGEANRHAKLTEAQVLEARRRYLDGERQAALAAEYGVSARTLADAINGATWAHVGDPADVVAAKALARSERGWRQRGELNVNAKLTHAAVTRIRRLYAAGGASQAALARQFGVSRATVQRVVAGRGWRRDGGGRR